MNARVRTPTVLQMENAECGAASLSMVLGYFGRFVPLAELRSACGVSRNGSNALSITRAARYYGLEAKGFRRDAAELQSLPLPQVLFWNQGHFLVLEGLDEKRAYLNDPARGRRTVSLDELKAHYSGIVLTFAPGPEFKRGGTPLRTARALRRRLRGAGAGLAYCILAGVALVVPSLATAVASKLFIDDVLVRGFTGWVAPLLGGLAVAALLSAAIASLQQRYLSRLNAKLSIGSAVEFIKHALMLPVEFYAERQPTEIAWRASLNDRVASLLSGRLTKSLLGFVEMLLLLLVMIAYDPLLASITALLGASTFAVLRAAALTNGDRNRHLLQEQGLLNSVTFAGIRTIETIKASGAESEFFTALMERYAPFAKSREHLLISAPFLRALPALIVGVALAAILGVGGLQVMQHTMSIGALVAFTILAFHFMAPFPDFVALGGELRDIGGIIERLDDVVTSPVQADSSTCVEAVRTRAPLDGARLELRGVTFGYSRAEPPLVEDFSLVVEPGRRIALVGRGGCGKSTISRLACGLYAPWSGSVLIDDLPHARWSRDALSRTIALVDGDALLFTASVRENLTLWDDSLSDEPIVRAAKDALIHEAIMMRPNGYETAVLEGGVNYSGGERQRLEIARALARDPAIIVLDDATSAVDTTLEAAIDRNLRERGCTCLVVSHRLSSIRACDEIVVLDNGRISERGTHEQLEGSGGIYAELLGA